MSQNDTLTRGMRRAIPALLAHATVADAAEAAELTPRTIYRYFEDPTFKAELRKRQNEIVKQTIAAMIGGRAAALKTLQAAQGDPEASWSERIRAAHYWLTHAGDEITRDVIIERLEALEAKL